MGSPFLDTDVRTIDCNVLAALLSFSSRIRYSHGALSNEVMRAPLLRPPGPSEAATVVIVATVCRCAWNRFRPDRAGRPQP